MKKAENVYVIVRSRYNYPDEMRVVSEDYKSYDDANDYAYGLNLGIMKETRREKFKIPN
jgi:hypothetical protein